MIAVIALPDDRARGERLTEALLAERLAPKLLPLAPTDPGWAEQVKAATAAEAIVMCWSRAALAPAAAGYRALAETCVDRDLAVFVMLDDAALPPAIAGASRYPLQPWQFGPRNFAARLIVGDRFLRDIVIAAQNKAAGLDPPPPSAMVLFYRRCALAGLSTLSALIITAGGLKQAFDYADEMIPDAKEEAAWATIPVATAQTCDGLQRFVDAYPDSRHAPQAQAALANPVTNLTWVRQSRPLLVPDALLAPRASDQTAAQNLARNALQTRAASACADLAEASGARPKGHTVTIASMQCDRIGADWSCRTEARATCLQDEPRATPVCTRRR